MKNYNSNFLLMRTYPLTYLRFLIKQCTSLSHKLSICSLLVLLALGTAAPLYAQNCSPEGTTFEFIIQEHVDNFQANYPNCNIITGNVLVMNDLNFSALDGITEIRGNLTMRQVRGDILNIFPNLTTILGNLLIDSSTGSRNSGRLSGFSNLSSIGGDLQMIHISSLTEIPSFSSLVSVNGDVKIAYSRISVDLPSLTSIEGNLHFNNVGGLGDFAMLNSVGGSLTIHSSSTPPGFSGHKNKISDLASFPNLISIGSYLGIRFSGGNEPIKKISGFANLENVNIVDISGEMDEITGFTRLRSLQRLALERTNLTDLNAFSNLLSVENLRITGNENLVDLSDLNNISGPLSSLTIRGNINLNYCHIKAVCDYITSANPIGTINITGNKAGGNCEDKQIVEAYCTSCSGNAPELWYLDTDGDGYGNTSSLIVSCNQPPPSSGGVYVDKGGDHLPSAQCR